MMAEGNERRPLDGSVTINIYISIGLSDTAPPKVSISSAPSPNAQPKLKAFDLVAKYADLAKVDDTVPQPPLSKTDVFERVLRVVAKIAKQPPDMFTQNTILTNNLNDNGAGIDPAHLGGIAIRLSDAFEDVETEVTIPEVEENRSKIKTIGALAKFMWPKIPQQYRKEGSANAK